MPAPAPPRRFPSLFEPREDPSEELAPRQLPSLFSELREDAAAPISANRQRRSHSPWDHPPTAPRHRSRAQFIIYEDPPELASLDTPPGHDFEDFNYNNKENIFTTPPDPNLPRDQGNQTPPLDPALLRGGPRDVFGLPWDALMDFGGLAQHFIEATATPRAEPVVAETDSRSATQVRTGDEDEDENEDEDELSAILSPAELKWLDRLNASVRETVNQRRLLNRHSPMPIPLREVQTQRPEFLGRIGRHRVTRPLRRVNRRGRTPER